MSACFYLERKMHLCYLDPFNKTFQNRNGTEAHKHGGFLSPAERAVTSREPTHRSQVQTQAPGGKGIGTRRQHLLSRIP